MNVHKRSELCKDKKAGLKVGDAVRGCFTGRLGFITRPHVYHSNMWYVLWLVPGRRGNDVGVENEEHSDFLEPVNVSLVLEDE